MAELKKLDEMTGSELDALAAKLKIEDYKKSATVAERREMLRPHYAEDANAAADGEGPAAEGDPGTAPVGPDGAADGVLEPPSADEDGAPPAAGTHEGDKKLVAGAAAETPDDYPAVQAATMGNAEPVDPSFQGDVAEHPLGVRDEREQALADTSHDLADAAYTGDVVEHPVPVRESHDEAMLKGSGTDSVVEPSDVNVFNAIAQPDGERDYTRGFGRGDLSADEKKALAKR